MPSGWPYDERMRGLVMANAADADPGFVGEYLRGRGFSLILASRETPELWPDVAEFDLVLLLGSEWSVYWEAVGSSVSAECELVRKADAIGIPVLAICFGAQIVSHAFGGSVDRAVEPEVGWYDIESDLPDAISAGPWLQWHYDRFSLPEGFTSLASSPVGPQAMSRGRILATQFHPEATEGIVARWSSGDGVAELERLRIDAEALVAQTRRNVVESRAACDRLLDWFMAETLGS